MLKTDKESFMKKSNYIVSLLCALGGHAVGFAMLLVFTSLLLAFDLPFGYSSVFSIIAIFAGSAFCGFFVKLCSKDLVCALLSGLAFSFVVIAVSFFGEGADYSVLMRVVIGLLLIITCVTAYLIPVKKRYGKRRRKISQSVIARNIK